MRTLKKTLALVLVFAMMIGFGAIGASAAFTDVKADNKYKEAIDVLSGIGVIDGMTKDTFAPDGTLTREQAAKMVAYLTLGPTNAKLISSATSQKFTDVKADRWSAGYIEYCANVGIISGVGDKKFNPEGKLTSAAFTKMLLVALGYKADAENMTGESWAINVASLAVTAGIVDKGISISAGREITRGEACQLAFKTLTAKTVQYTGGISMNINGVIVTQGATRSFIPNDHTTGYLPTDNDAFMQFCESHFSGLKTTVAASDNFGRPGVYSWKNGTKTIAVVSTAAVVSYTGAVKTGTIYKDLGLTSGTSGTKVLGTNVFTNGAAGATTANDVTIAKNGNVIVGGNGIVTEVYADASGAILAIVKIVPTFGQITSVTNGKELSGSTFSEYTISYGTSDSVKGKVYTSAINNEDDTFLPTAAVSKGDYVTFYASSKVSTVINVSPVTTVTGKLTSYSSATASYTIAGNNYMMSNATGAAAPTVYNTTAVYAIDSYGYLLGSITIATASNYLYVVATGTESWVLDGTSLVKSIVANVMLMDGTVAKGAVATVGNAPATNANVTAGLYTYSMTAKGAYVLTAVTAAANDTLAPNNPTVAPNKYANAATKFIFSNWTKDETGATVFAGTANIVTGYSNIPTLSAVSGSYVDANLDNIVEVVFVNSKTATSAAKYAYYLGTSSTTDGTLYAYDFIVNGVVTTISGVNGLNAAGMYTIAANTATAISFSPEVELALTGTAKDGLYAAKSIVNNGGLLCVDGNYKAPVAASVPVYTISAATGTVVVGTAADLSTPNVGNLVITQSAGAVTSIYVIA